MLSRRKHQKGRPGAQNPASAGCLPLRRAPPPRDSKVTRAITAAPYSYRIEIPEAPFGIGYQGRGQPVQYSFLELPSSSAAARLGHAGLPGVPDRAHG